MKISLDQLYSSGQMAKLCRISKDTLYFYEKKGLIKPAKTLDNGYRFYDIRNFLQLDMITDLKSAGCALREIKEFLFFGSSEDYIEFLQLRLKDLNQEKERISKLQRKLESAVNLTESAMSRIPGSIGIVQRREKKIIVRSLADEACSTSNVSGLYTFSGLIQQCLEAGFTPNYDLSAMIEKESLKSGEYTPDSYFAFCPPEEHIANYSIMPAGTYLMYIHKGPYRNLPQVYMEKVIPYLKEHRYDIIGNSYECSLLGWFNTSNEEDYITEVLIQIK